MSDTSDMHLHTGFAFLSVYFGTANFLRHNLTRKYNQLNPHNFKTPLLLFYRISLCVLTPHGALFYREADIVFMPHTEVNKI